MIKIKSLDFFKKTAIFSFLVGICIFLILFSETSAKFVKLGMHYCIDFLIPSLFPFMFISSFVVMLTINMNCNTVVQKITKFLFFLPGYTLPLILLSLVGGYPVGAKCAKILLDNKKITTKQLNFLMCFCVNSGPAFIIAILGNQILNNKFIGLVIFLVQVILAILMGIGISIKERIAHKNFYFENKSFIKKKQDNIPEIFVTSAKIVSESLIEMCALIILFSVCIGMLNDIGIFKIISGFLLKKLGVPILDSKTFFVSFLEITSACMQAVRCSASPVVLAFAVGFGGLCAHLQIAAILRDSGFNFKKFLFFRLINGVLTSLIVYIFMIFYEDIHPVFSTVPKNLILIKSNALKEHGSLALFMLCIYFLVSINFRFKRGAK